MQFIHRPFAYIVLLSAYLLFSAFGLSAVSSAQQTGGDVEWGSAVRIPSPGRSASWFPDLAVDREGRVHVVWCETDYEMANLDPNAASLSESVYYSMWNGQQWSQPNDIVPPQQNIVRNAVAVDGYNVLHFLFDYSPAFGLYYRRAQASRASSAAAWTPPRLVNGRRGTYMSDIAVHQDYLHIIYDDRGAEDGECPSCADIFYRHSSDRGLTWSAPVNLSPSSAGSSRAQIEVDAAGTIYVAWDEGWDRLSGRGDPRYGVYIYSTDGGDTWGNSTIVSHPLVTPTITPSPTPAPTVASSPTAMPTTAPRPTVTPTIVSYPNSTNAQLSVGSNGHGGVMLVWRTTSEEYPGIYCMWSTDYGESWSPPKTLPRIIARPWDTAFDLYDMAADSVGHIHLLAVARESQERDAMLGVYHLVWNGDRWSTPERIFAAEGLYPEYPKIVIHEGNQLHAVWFTREASIWDPEANRDVWYISGQSSTPHQPATPMPTPTPSPSPPTATPFASTSTPFPTLSLENTGLLPTGLYTESDDLFRLAIALSPVALMILVVMVIKIGSGKLRR